jgi:hypothetical protein
MIRMNVGIEHIDDIIDDLDQPLDRVRLELMTAMPSRQGSVVTGSRQTCCRVLPAYEVPVAIRYVSSVGVGAAGKLVRVRA